MDVDVRSILSVTSIQVSSCIGSGNVRTQHGRVILSEHGDRRRGPAWGSSGAWRALPDVRLGLRRATNPGVTIKMGQPGRDTLNWPGIAVEAQPNRNRIDQIEARIIGALVRGFYRRGNPTKEKRRATRQIGVDLRVRTVRATP